MPRNQSNNWVLMLVREQHKRTQSQESWLVTLPGLAQLPPHDWYSPSRNDSHSERDRDGGYGIGRTGFSDVQTRSNCPSRPDPAHVNRTPRVLGLLVHRDDSLRGVQALPSNRPQHIGDFRRLGLDNGLLPTDKRCCTPLRSRRW